MIINTIPESDKTGSIVFNSDIPYDNILTRPRVNSGVDTTTAVTGGTNQTVRLPYNFDLYPPSNDNNAAAYDRLVPDSENVILYSDYGGITYTNYLLTTENIDYPVLITDNYSRWAVPPYRINPQFIYSAKGCCRDFKNDEWVVFGVGGSTFTSGGDPKTFSNFITSKNGLVWSGLKYNNPYLDSISAYTVDNVSDIGIAIGEGSTYSMAILAGSSADKQGWFPIVNSNELMIKPKGIIRGPSWIVYGSTGNSNDSSIIESTNGLVWTGITGIYKNIISADINQFSGKCMAISTDTLYIRDPDTAAWSSGNVNTIFENQTALLSISNIAFGPEYSAQGSSGVWLAQTSQTGFDGTFFWISRDDGVTWQYDDTSGLATALSAYSNVFLGTDSSVNYQDLEFFGNDLNGQLNILELSVTGTTGQLAYYSYGLIELQGLTGLNVNGYGSVDAKQLDGITYASFLNEINPSLLDGLNAIDDPSQTITIPNITGLITLGLTGQAYAGVSGATGFMSPNSYSSFDFTFKTDIYSSKNVVFDDGSNTYTFTINDYNNSSVTGGTIYSYKSTSPQSLDGVTYGLVSNIFNNGLVCVQNVNFGSMYESQITSLNSMLTEISTLIDILGSTSGLESFFSGNNYNNQFLKGFTGSTEISKFYTPVRLVQDKNIGSYNFDTFNGLEHLEGYPITDTLLNLQQLYTKDGPTGTQFTEILNKFRTLEYFLTYESHLFTTIQSLIQGSTQVATLITVLKLIQTSLNNNLILAKRNLNNAKTPNILSLSQLTYNSNTVFRFTFDGSLLRFYKDSIILHEFDIFDSSDLSVDININSKLRKTPEVVDKSTATINSINFRYNTNNQIKTLINSSIVKTQSEVQYIDQMKYVGLIPDTDLNNQEVQDSLNTILNYINNQGELTSCLSYKYTLDYQNIDKNYFYSLSNFIKEPKLLALVGTLMMNNLSDPIVFNYFDVKNYSNNHGSIDLPKSNGFQTYDALYTRDTSTGYFRLTYLLFYSYKAIVKELSSFSPNYQNYMNYIVSNSFFRQTSIDVLRQRYIYEDKVVHNPSANQDDYKHILDLVTSEIFNAGTFKDLLRLNGSENYKNLITNTYDNTAVTGKFPVIPDRKFVFDFMYNDIDANINGSSELNAIPRAGVFYPAMSGYSLLNNLTGNNITFGTPALNNVLLNDYNTSGSTGTQLTQFLDTAKHIGDLVHSLPSDNTKLSVNIAKTIYASFFSDVLDSAGVTYLNQAFLQQNKTDYSLLKKYLDKLINKTSTDGTLDKSYLSPKWHASDFTSQKLCGVNNQFLSFMNDARTYGCTALFDINQYNTILAEYGGMTFVSQISTENLLSYLPSIYDRTFIPLLKTILLDKFQLDFNNPTHYFSKEQDSLFKRYCNFVDGSTSSDYSLMSNTGTTYSLVTNRYIDVNAIYIQFGRDTYDILQGIVDTTFAARSGIADDLALVESIVDGSNPILKQYNTTKTNLDAQANVYISNAVSFNGWINSNKLLNNVLDGYARFNAMSNTIMANDDGPEVQPDAGLYSDFIMNIPPFDTKYWNAVTGSSGIDNYTYARYNSSYRYYCGDTIVFDNYGSTGFSVYQCINTVRGRTIQGISPGTTGINGTINSLVCWSEYHDIPEFDINNRPSEKCKYNEFNYNELNYYLRDEVSNNEYPYQTQLYSSTGTYLTGDIVIYNNAPFIMTGSDGVYSGVGKGIPPGFNDSFDTKWKPIGIAGESLYEYPGANGVWVLDPYLNEDFVAFRQIYDIDDIITRKNAQNKFIVPDKYNSNYSYVFGDLVLYNNLIYTCQANNISGIDPPSDNTLKGYVLWKAQPYITSSGLPQFSITQAYNVGQLVSYKNVAYKFIFDNANIPNFQGSTGDQPLGYSYLDKVEYGGYVFASKINNNISEPLIPVDLAAVGVSGANYTLNDLLTSQYWDYVSGVSGYTGTLPANYNFNHDYCYDYNVLEKGKQVLVTFASSIWRWKYNPFNIDYTTAKQQQFPLLSAIKGVPPPLPEPLTQWKPLDVSLFTDDELIGIGNYNDSAIYQESDVVIYDGFYFRCNGFGYGSAVVNEDGDDLLVFPYSPSTRIFNGTLVGNSNSNRTYLASQYILGNEKDNSDGLVDLMTGKTNTGTPKWGDGVLYDPWALDGFALNVRKTFADNIELTYNVLVHDVQTLQQLQGNIQIPDSLTGLVATRYQGLTKNSVLASISCGSGDVATIRSSTGKQQSTGWFLTLERMFDKVQFLYYSSVIKNLKVFHDRIIVLNRYLNNIKKAWKDVHQEIFQEGYLSYYRNAVWYPGSDGTQINSKDFQLDAFNALGVAFMEPGDSAENMKNFLSTYNSAGNATINSRLFDLNTIKAQLKISDRTVPDLTTLYGDSAYYSLVNNGGVTGITGASYYNLVTGVNQGPTASANAIYLNSGSFETSIRGNIKMSFFSPAYSYLFAQYTNANMQIQGIQQIIRRLIGYDLTIPMANNEIVNNVNNLYSNGSLIDVGTDTPIVVPILTSNDLDTLQLYYGDSIHSRWFADPLGIKGPSEKGAVNGDQDRIRFNFGRSEMDTYLVNTNNAMSEPSLVGVLPNNYQYKAVEYTMRHLYNTSYSDLKTTKLNDTGSTANLRTNVINKIWNENSISSYPLTATGVLTTTTTTNDFVWNNGPAATDASVSGNLITQYPSLSIVQGGPTAFALSNSLVLFQPIGSISVNNYRNDHNSRIDDGERDLNRGIDSPSADRAIEGASVPAGVLSARGDSAPMKYNKPNMIALTEDQLWSTQGKKDITANNQYQSTLTYVSHIILAGQVPPTYSTVNDITAHKEVLKGIRRNVSAAVKSTGSQILVVVIVLVIAIAITLASYGTLGPAAAGMVASVTAGLGAIVTGIGVAATAAGVAIAATSTIAATIISIITTVVTTVAALFAYVGAAIATLSALATNMLVSGLAVAGFAAGGFVSTLVLAVASIASQMAVGAAVAAAVKETFQAIVTAAGDKKAKRFFENALLNPVAAFTDPVDVFSNPQNLSVRCSNLNYYTNLYSDETSVGAAFVITRYNRVTYEEYKWAQKYLYYIVNNVAEVFFANYNYYYVEGTDGIMNGVLKTANATDKEIADYYLAGLSGMNFNSLAEYDANYSSTLPSGFEVNNTRTDLNNLLNRINTHRTTIAKYESSLLYPRFIRNNYESIQRSAVITIRNAQFGPSIVDTTFLTTSSVTTYPTNGTLLEKQLFATFSITDPGEGFFEDDGGGTRTGVLRNFDTLTVNLLDANGVSLGKTISFEDIQIVAGYCKEGNQETSSIYGINKFTFITGQGIDYGKLSFTYSGTLTNSTALNGTKFLITYNTVNIPRVGNAGGGLPGSAGAAGIGSVGDLFSVSGPLNSARNLRGIGPGAANVGRLGRAGLPPLHPPAPKGIFSANPIARAAAAKQGIGFGAGSIGNYPIQSIPATTVVRGNNSIALGSSRGLLNKSGRLIIKPPISKQPSFKLPDPPDPEFEVKNPFSKGAPEIRQPSGRGKPFTGLDLDDDGPQDWGGGRKKGNPAIDGIRGKVALVLIIAGAIIDAAIVIQGILAQPIPPIICNQ